MMALCMMLVKTIFIQSRVQECLHVCLLQRELAHLCRGQLMAFGEGCAVAEHVTSWNTHDFCYETEFEIRTILEVLHLSKSQVFSRKQHKLSNWGCVFALCCDSNVQRDCIHFTFLHSTGCELKESICVGKVCCLLKSVLSYGLNSCAMRRVANMSKLQHF
jgi:hypothetical protein